MQSSLVLSAPPTLGSLLGEPAGLALFLDFDGTLVELAPGPDAIAPRPGLSALLTQLGKRLDGRCAIVSGRAISDIEKHIGALSIAAAGSHGSDIRVVGGEKVGAGPTHLPESIKTELRAFAAANDLDFEQKPHGGALHYRRNPDSGDIAHDFAEKLAREHGWAVQSGKCVVELVAKDANKGSAVETLMNHAAFRGARPLFIGDDLTDEAGFEVCEQLGGAGVLVGSRSETHARYKLPTVAAVHQWLEF